MIKQVNFKFLTVLTLLALPAWAAPPECPTIVQFNPKPDSNIFPKCVNAAISKDDFVIVTDPESAVADVTVTYSPDPTSTAGSHTATATLCENTKQATYQVVGSGQWVPMANIPLPTLGTWATSSPTTLGPVAVDNGAFTFTHTWYRDNVTWSGSYVWNEIGRDTVAAGNTFQTSVATAWGVTGEVAGTAKIKAPFVGSVEATATIGANWQTTTTKTLTSGPDAAPFQYRYVHYQKCSAINMVVASEKAQGPDGTTVPTTGWTSHTQAGWTGTTTAKIPLSGTTEFCQTTERKCP